MRNPPSAERPTSERPARGRGASLRIRLTLLLALVLLPATVLLVYAGYESSRRARAEAEQDLLRLSELVAASQAQRLADARSLLALIAQFPEVQAGDPAACSARLAELLPFYPAYSGLGLADLHGNVYCTALPLTSTVNVSDRAWYQWVLSTNDFAVGDYVLGRTGRPTLGLGYPVRNSQGQVSGVASLGLNLLALNEAAANIPLPDDTDLLLFDANGTVLAHAPDSDRWLGENHAADALAQRALTGQPAVTQLPGLDATPRLYATLVLHHLGGQPLYLALGRPPQAVYAAADSIQLRNLAAIVLLEALALITIWQASRRLLLRPVDELLRATRRVTVGDLSARTDLQHDRGELGQLALAFDHMADTLSRQDAERRAAEAELRVSWEHYRRLVELSPDTVFVMQAGQVVYINAAGARLLGAEQPAALVGQPVLTTFVHPDDRARLAGALQQLNGPAPMPLTEVRWQTLAGAAQRGRSLEVEVAATAIEHEQQPAVLVIVRNITARKQLERRRTALAETAQPLAQAGANYQAVLDLVARQAGAHIGGLAVLRVYSPSTRALATAAAYHPDPARQAALERQLTLLEPAIDSLSGGRAGSTAIFLPEIDPVELLTTAPPEVRNFFQQFPVYGLLGAPLSNRQRLLGALSLLRDYPGQPFLPEDLAFLQELADRAALALDNAQLYAAEQVARAAAERAARLADQQAVRLARLQTITAAFSEALSLDAVLDVMIEQTMAVLDADAGAVVLLADDGVTLAVVRTLNFPSAAVVSRFPLESGAPASEVVRTCTAVWVETPAEFAARFPAFAPARQSLPYQSVTYLPLEAEGRCLGSLVINFVAPHTFPQEERALLLAMARQGAQALLRTRAYEAERVARAAAEVARQRLAFLAEISRALAASLDYASTLQTVLRQTLPTLADFCTIYQFSPAGQVETVALAHRDPDREPLLRALEAFYRPELGPAGGLFAQAAHQRVPRYTQSAPEQLAGQLADPQATALLRELQVESVLHAPLISSGRALGMLTLVYAGSGRHYGPGDLDVVQEVTRRAAVALENAQLYAEAQRLNAQLEARVSSRTAQLAAANVHLEAEVVERTRMEAELAQSHTQLRELNAYMQTAREDERTRISREIHDELGGTLTGLKMDVARIRKAVEGHEAAEKVSPRLEALSQLIDEMVQTVRRIATDLRPALLDDFGLAAAIEWQLQEFAKRSGLTCTFDTPLDELEWDAAASTGVFRAFQETLTNVARHAQASRVTVSLTQAGDLVALRVQDDGRGLPTSAPAGLKSLGLAGMRERIAALNGRLTISGAAGQGTTVLIEVPLARLLRQPPAP